jgi:hypothetical protein
MTYNITNTDLTWMTWHDCKITTTYVNMSEMRTWEKWMNGHFWHKNTNVIDKHELINI